ncbi:glutathione S-transferase family protein [Bradyrhizobium sp. HKCCYLRH3099]|uniref:glutathione S-transferase family protein n=1 Tax=unclassified Bradyrhizobium TaxID=2631580 RepID=UPI003EBAB04C
MTNQPTDVYRIFGAEMSPYSVKVRSYLRYKGIPHQWILRSAETEAEFTRHAKLPLVPLVVAPDEVPLQDSTPIIDALELDFPEPSVHPGDVLTSFISALIEEFGDEWGNKWMFHYRWAGDLDQRASAGRIARMVAPKAADADVARLADKIRARMVARLAYVGSNEANAPQIEQGFVEMLDLLERHLALRPYLFGARPAYGDFGLWGQFYELWTDPTAGALIEGRAPHVLAWIQRMLWPRAEGEFELWPELSLTLMPILTRQVGGLFMPWSLANEKAIKDSRDTFSVELGDVVWTQKPQKYHARSLAMLRSKYAFLHDRSRLDVVLEEIGCLAALQTAAA